MWKSKNSIMEIYKNDTVTSITSVTTIPNTKLILFMHKLSIYPSILTQKMLPLAFPVGKLQ